MAKPRFYACDRKVLNIGAILRKREFPLRYPQVPVEVPRGTPGGTPSRSFERIKEQKECMFPNSDVL